jgi:hypothetical protein
VPGKAGSRRCAKKIFECNHWKFMAFEGGVPSTCGNILELALDSDDLTEYLQLYMAAVIED